MRKILVLLLCACLAALPAFAGAERTVVTALASAVNMDDLVSISTDARITEYDAASNTLTIEIIVPERYLPEEILNLKPGDAIYTQGQEVEIRTVTDNAGYIVLNEGDYEFSEGSIWLFESLDNTYWIADYDDNSWLLMGTVYVSVPDRLLFLDEIVPSTGESLMNPTVYSGPDFLEIFASERNTGPGFAINNVTVVFDENGELALIRRFYVPWQ